MTIIGLNKFELDTPSLLIDLDVMENNISNMADYYKGIDIGLRPHVKPHKCPIIAHKQIQAGAIGITCQKLGEAEVMAFSGIKDILIANQIANVNKIKRFVNLARRNNVIVAIDDLNNAKQISSAASSKGIKADVLIEVSGGRCGVEAGEPALLLAREIVKMKGLRFRGILYHKGVSSYKNYQERRKIHFKLLEPVIETREIIEDAGIDVEILSAGATATYNITPEISGVTEVQPGKYVFMDRVYKEVEGMELFDYAMTILATVISRPNRDTAIIDVGLKSRGSNYGAVIPPLVKDIDGVEVIKFSAEHGHLKLEEPNKDLKIGDKLELFPSNCGTTANIYNDYIGVRDDVVEVVWPISARGRAD
jgi:D-serine deaminase-like pyridoxal phosphate-dependent protein